MFFGTKRRSGAAVAVLEADDVVLAEIRARLHLDQHQRDASRVLDLVDAAERQVGALILADEKLPVVPRHQRAAVDDDPVLGAMEMLLQAELGAGVDDDALDLEPAALGQRLVIAPRPAHAVVRLGLGPLSRAQPRDDLLDRLGLVAAKHEHRVGGGDDDRVLDPDHGGQRPVAADKAVAAACEHHVAGGDVAVAVLGADLPQRVPAADIGPAEIRRHHRAAGGALGHRVVEAANAAGSSRTTSPSRRAAASAAATASKISGAWVRNSACKVAAVKANIPAFHRQFPEATRSAARAASGFSIKRAIENTRPQSSSGRPSSI